MSLRYQETGAVHLDFHRTTNGTIAYLRKHYGLRFLDGVFERTARDVYRSIRRDLKRGDPKQLLKHWTYFFDREKGRYKIDRKGDTVRMTVRRCPAIAYLKKRGIKIDPAFCRQTVVINRALAKGTPFDIVTDVLGDGRCVQTLGRRRP